MSGKSRISRYLCFLVDQVNFYRKYVPEVAKFPLHLIFCPWKATKEEQEAADCIIGQQYPEPCIDHDVAMERNTKYMKIIRMATLSRQ